MMRGMGAMAGMRASMAATPAPAFDPALLDRMVGNAAAQKLAFPAMVVPPGAPAGEGGSGKPATGWLVKSEAQDRPLRVTLRYDARTGALQSRDDFAAKYPVDRIVAYAIAWHEGQLFGWVNQLIGLITALALVTVTVSGLVMWLKRKPAGAFGAPPPAVRREWPRGWGFGVLAVFLLVWLPLFTASLSLVALIDGLVVAAMRRRAAA